MLFLALKTNAGLLEVDYMNILDTLDAVIEKMGQADKVFQQQEEAKQNKNPFAEQALDTQLEALIGEMENLADMMDDSDWADVEEGVNLYFEQEENQDSWLALGPLMMRYKEAKQNGDEAAQRRLLPLIAGLSQRIRQDKTEDER